MPATALALALGAAVLHASWNLVVKASGDRLLTAWGQVTFGALVFAPFLGQGLTGPALCLAAISGAAHLAYTVALVAAYRHLPFSLAYPLARGSAPLLVTTAGVVLLHDRLSVVAVLGVATASAGILLLGRPFSTGVADLRWPLLTGAVIAAYTTFDANAARGAAQPLPYVAAVFAANAALFAPVVVRTHGVGTVARHVRDRGPWLVGAGAASAASYGLVLLAVRHAPAGAVSAVRETSVVLGVIGARLVLAEEVTLRRAVAVVVVVAGVAVMALS